MKNNIIFYTNNVDPTTQVKFPYYFDGVNKNEAKLKVLFLGNSITYHEEAPKIGWNKNCGMAASDIEHDYVHLIYQYLKTKEPLTSICVYNAASFESDFNNKDKFKVIDNVIKDYNADLIIIRLGENCNRKLIQENIDITPYFKLLVDSCIKFSKKVIITSLFWHQEKIDSAIKNIADECKISYVDISDLGEKDECKAIGQYEHQGICGHPSNDGMKQIAERIIKAI